MADLAPELQGRRPEGLPYSAWELVEHIRRVQREVLDSCRTRHGVEPTVPDDHWPAAPEPHSPTSWAESIEAYRADRAAFTALIADPRRELGALVPRMTGETTYLRSVLLVADHTAYHVGQLVVVRRLLGAWPADSPGGQGR